MKPVSLFFLTTILSGLVIADPHHSARDSTPLTREQAAAAFEQLKSLAGEWQGHSERNGKERLVYEIVGRGSAVMERYADEKSSSVDSMLTVYYLDGSRLLLTHYCVAGNQPRMAATHFDPVKGDLDFEFLDATNLPDAAAGHMHNFHFRFVDRDHVFVGSDFFSGDKLKFAESDPYVRVR
jgi:hypothetical protein